MYNASKGINGDGIRAKMDGMLGFVWFILWIVFVGLSAKDGEWTYIGWSFYMFLVLHITQLRSSMRAAHNIYGRGLHSSTSQLNLSRFCHKRTP